MCVCVCVLLVVLCVCACVRAVFVTLWLYSIVSIIFLYCLALITDSWSGAPKGHPRRAPRQGAERGHARADVGGECALHLARGPPGFPAAGEVLIARCTYTWQGTDRSRTRADATTQRACALMARRMHVHVGVGGASNQGAADVSKDVTPPPRRCRERTGDGVTQAVAVPARVWIGICLFWSLWQGSTRVPLKPLANGPDAATDGTLKHNNRESLLKRCMARSGRQS